MLWTYLNVSYAAHIYKLKCSLLFLLEFPYETISHGTTLTMHVAFYKLHYDFHLKVVIMLPKFVMVISNVVAFVCNQEKTLISTIWLVSTCNCGIPNP